MNFRLYSMMVLVVGATDAVFAAAPANLGGALFRRTDELLGFGGGYSTFLYLLRDDGTYRGISNNQQLNSTPRGYYPVSDGAYTYTVSGTDPNQATLTLGSTMTLDFQTDVSGTINGGNLNTFAIYPTIVLDAAVNVSNRCWVNSTRPGIAGFVIGGTTSRWVLLRAVGPSLALLDVPTVVAEPTMALYRDNTWIRSFESWSDEPDLAAGRSVLSDMVGAFALLEDSADSVGLALLPPGQYTVVGGGATTDAEVLMEVYMLPFGENHGQTSSPWTP